MPTLSGWYLWHRAWLYSSSKLFPVWIRYILDDAGSYFILHMFGLLSWDILYRNRGCTLDNMHILPGWDICYWHGKYHNLCLSILHSGNIYYRNRSFTLVEMHILPRWDICYWDRESHILSLSLLHSWDILYRNRCIRRVDVHAMFYGKVLH